MDKISFGFTGTQEGMTDSQKEAVYKLLVYASLLHHGDCIGADSDAHTIADKLKVATVIHPPSNPSKRAFCNSDFICGEKSYLDRNHDIVNASENLIATPKESKEVLRSGTWATIRYCGKKNRGEYIVIYPDGSCTTNSKRILEIMEKKNVIT